MTLQDSPFTFNDTLKSHFHLIIIQWSKSKAGAARLESRDDLGQVVADQTEPGVLCEFFHHCNKTQKLRRSDQPHSSKATQYMG